MSKEVDAIKNRIFRKLDTVPQPPDYKSYIPWRVQQHIADTNGKHFLNSVGKITTYPIPAIPIEVALSKDELFLDIGSGWGRWLTAAGKKKYIPIGADLNLEFCETARMVMKDNNINGYTVVADLKELPFKENVFDVGWSFSTIQHNHKDRLLNCIKDIHRTLKSNGYCFLEFPNLNGIRNRMGPIAEQQKRPDDLASFKVRYYTIDQYKVFFQNVFNNFSYRNHSFPGHWCAA